MACSGRTTHAGNRRHADTGRSMRTNANNKLLSTILGLDVDLTALATRDPKYAGDSTAIVRPADAIACCIS